MVLTKSGKSHKTKNTGSSTDYWTATSTTVKKHIGLAANPWRLYKKTWSAATSTTSDLTTLLGAYFTYTESTNLACNTSKIVSTTGQNDYTAEAFHFVDSDVFYDSTDKPVETWYQVVTELGYDKYNVFMNHYNQLYTDNLAPVLDTVKGNGFTSYYARLSYTPGSSTLNVAHLVMYIAAGGIYIDVTAPLSSVPEAYLAEFTEWSEDECAGAHQLKYELEDYNTLLDSSAISYPDWGTSTGLTTPLFISAGVPITSLSKVDDIFTMVGTITNMTETTVVYDACSYREVVIDAAYDDDSTITSTVIRYIQQDSTIQGTTAGYTLADWEGVVEMIYEHQKTEDHKGHETWSRYLDNHIGFESNDNDGCDDSKAWIQKGYDSIPNSYVISKRSNLHYYTGMPGIVSWEFNAVGCDSADQICGCIDINSGSAYTKIYGTPCSG